MEEKVKTKSNKSSILWLLSVCFIAVGLLLFCQFYFGDAISDKTTFYENTHVNGIDISGMTKDDAKNLLNTTFAQNKNNIKITLKSPSKEWEISGKDLTFVGEFDKSLDNILQYGRDGNIFNKKKIENQIKKEGLNVNIPYQDLLSGIDSQIEIIANEIEILPTSSSIIFNPNSENMFSINPSAKGYILDRNLLEKEINDALQYNESFVINLPIQEITPNENLEDMIKQIKLRSKFTTNYAKSSENRKTNIKTALKNFNGMIVEPGQEISFNKTTGPRNNNNGYKNANIIFDGNYISGVGGGVCQASTTLYNALLLADVEILQVTHHSLPASYVPLSFDAMVSEGYADLVFKNNLDTPIFIKTICSNEEVSVEIYGQPFDDDITIKTKSELVKVLPHGGDNIITDTKGEYSNKVLYKGEYYRLKFPQEGYESKGYIQYIKNGEIIEEKLIRHDHYRPQNGIIVEGNATLEEGMTLPSNGVKYISPQKVTQTTIDNAKKKWKVDN